MNNTLRIMALKGTRELMISIPFENEGEHDYYGYRIVFGKSGLWNCYDVTLIGEDDDDISSFSERRNVKLMSQTIMLESKNECCQCKVEVTFFNDEEETPALIDVFW